MNQQLPSHTGWLMPAPEWPLWYWPGWLGSANADTLLAQLDARLAWQQPSIRLFGKYHLIPRQQLWMGDPGLDYRYSGKRFTPSPWIPELAALRQSLQAHVQQLARALDWPHQPPFNSVLINRYRNGQDKMGWHQDNEPELGADPIIASVTLGAARAMRFRPTAVASAAHKQAFNLLLEHASLLVMGPGSQRQLAHSIPARSNAGLRINLTFRTIINDA